MLIYTFIVHTILWSFAEHDMSSSQAFQPLNCSAIFYNCSTRQDKNNKHNCLRPNTCMQKWIGCQDLHLCHTWHFPEIDVPSSFPFWRALLSSLLLIVVIFVTYGVNCSIAWDWILSMSHYKEQGEELTRIRPSGHLCHGYLWRQLPFQHYSLGSIPEKRSYRI